MCPRLHTAWSFRLRLDKPWVSFVRVGLTLCTVMTTSHMADGKREVQRRATRDIRCDTDTRLLTAMDSLYPQASWSHTGSGQPASLLLCPSFFC